MNRSQALLLPEVDPSSWQLRIHGMVQREVTLSFAELLRQPLIEDYVTLTCVSNPVGGSYAGMPTRTAEIRNVWSASMVVRREAFTAVGGFRVGFGKNGDQQQQCRQQHAHVPKHGDADKK